VKANGGAPGVDKVTIDEVEIYGVDKYLEELGEDLRKQTYEPQAVKRVMIPKANGGERPLGIPKLLSYYFITVSCRNRFPFTNIR
jgi:retron-type reverse transcriptase